MNISIFRFTPLNIHPLFYIAAAYIIGVAAQAQHCLLLQVVLCTSTIALGCVHTYLHKKIPTVLVAILAGLLLGSFLLQQQISRHERFYTQTKTLPHNVRGIICSISRIDHYMARYCIKLDIKKVRRLEGRDWQPLPATIQLYAKSPGAMRVADRVQINNLKFKRPKNKDFERYAIKEGITATIFTQSIDYRLLERPQSSWRRWLFYQREKIVTALKKKMSLRTFALAASVFLGYKATIKRALNQPKEQFKAWGVSHYLARSGLHLVIFVAIWYFMLSLLPIAFLMKELLVAFLCILYFMLSWSSISFIRAFTLFMLYKLCTFLHAQPNFLHLLTILCLGVLLYNPMQLFFLDFQLSFALTFTLAWFNHTYRQKVTIVKKT